MKTVRVFRTDSFHMRSCRAARTMCPVKGQSTGPAVSEVLLLWVKCVPQAVAHEVDAEHCDRNEP